MLVFLSDLHSTDDSSGTTIHRRAVGDAQVSDLLNHFPIKIQKYIQLDKYHQLIMQLREIDNVRAPPKYSCLDPGECAAIFPVSRPRSIDSLPKFAGELLCMHNEVQRRISPGARTLILSAGGESCWFS